MTLPVGFQERVDREWGRSQKNFLVLLPEEVKTSAFRQLASLYMEVINICADAVKGGELKPRLHEVVGDTSCQIRAMLIAESILLYQRRTGFRGELDRAALAARRFLSNKGGDDRRSPESIDKQITGISRSLARLRTQLENPKNENHRQGLLRAIQRKEEKIASLTVLRNNGGREGRTYDTIQEYWTGKGLPAQCSRRLQGLILTHILTRSAVENKEGEQETDPSLLTKGLNSCKKLNNKFKYYVVEHSKELLAELSVSYLQALAPILTSPLINLQTYTRDELVDDGKTRGNKVDEKRYSRKILPCFVQEHLMTRYLIESDTPVALKVVGGVKLSLFYRSGKMRERLDLINELDDNNVVVAITAITDETDRGKFLSKLKQLTLERLIDLDGAQHPNYAGRNKNKETPDEDLNKIIAKFTAQALKEGCHEESKPRFLLIHHIWAERVKYLRS